MRAPPTLLLLCTLGLTSAAALASEHSAPGAEKTAMTDKARQLFQEGVAAYGKGKIQEAYASFLAAWSLNPHWQIAANLADIELELHKNREAAEHASYYRKHAPADRRENAEAQAKRALALVGTLAIEVDTAGPDVLVDDVEVGRAPLGEPVFLEPGPHRVVARFPGRPDAVQAVTLAAGGSERVSLKVLKNEQPDPRVAPGATGPSMPIVITGGALAAVGLIVGTALTVAANGKASSADTLRSMVGSNSACTGTAAGSNPNCAQLTNALNGHDAFTKGAFASFVIGGAFAAATVGLVVRATTTSKVEKGAPAVRVTPVLGRAQGGIVVLGSF